MMMGRRWGSGLSRRAHWFRVVVVAVALVLLALPSTRSTPALADELASNPTAPPESDAVGPAATQPPAPAAPSDLESFMLDLLNQVRVSEGLPPVRWDPVAAVAARQQAEELVRGGY